MISKEISVHMIAIGKEWDYHQDQIKHLQENYVDVVLKKDVLDTDVVVLLVQEEVKVQKDATALDVNMFQPLNLDQEENVVEALEGIENIVEVLEGEAPALEGVAPALEGEAPALEGEAQV
jgi:stress response protein SCP2